MIEAESNRRPSEVRGSARQDSTVSGQHDLKKPLGRTSRAQTLLMGLLAALLLLTTCLYARRVQAFARRGSSMKAQLSHMKLDASRILELRRAPQSALGQQRPNEELLATVEHALATATIARQRWQDSIPQPLTRVQGTNYQQQSTLLYFDDLTLRQLASFISALSQDDAALHVSLLGLTAGSPAGYDVEVAVSYRVYSPQQKGGF
ncbi:MAG: hypothetical protein IT449_07370 [Phycisphaerales bacterium]|nr:hypothetical protein [Phycisphaerales bacterium]